MNKLRNTIHRYIVGAEHYWESLPRRRQRLLTIVLFLSYVLATALSTLSLWSDGDSENSGFPKDHIEGVIQESKASNINQKLKE